MCNWEDRQ